MEISFIVFIKSSCYVGCGQQKIYVLTFVECCMNFRKVGRIHLRNIRINGLCSQMIEKKKRFFVRNKNLARFIKEFSTYRLAQGLFTKCVLFFGRRRVRYIWRVRSTFSIHVVVHRGRESGNLYFQHVHFVNGPLVNMLRKKDEF